MQHDDVIWRVINPRGGRCAFMKKLHQTDYADKFCRNPYSLTGLCDRKSCPLANSQYATVREVEGRLYLMMKTVERAHTPKNLWERILLDKNYAKALAKIDDELEYWPHFIRHKCKQRLTKLTQYLIRSRALAKKAATEPQLVRINKKERRRERTRERKALVASRLEQVIKKELLDRLKSRAYGTLYDDKVLNIPEKHFKRAFDEDAEEELESESEFNSEDDDYDSDEASELDFEGEYEREEEEDRPSSSKKSKQKSAPRPAFVVSQDDDDVEDIFDLSDSDEMFDGEDDDDDDNHDDDDDDDDDDVDFDGFNDDDDDDDDDDEDDGAAKRWRKKTADSDSDDDDEKKSTGAKRIKPAPPAQRGPPPPPSRGGSSSSSSSRPSSSSSSSSSMGRRGRVQIEFENEYDIDAKLRR